MEQDPDTPIDGTEEIVRAAGETGAAHMHYRHVNSTSLRPVDRVCTRWSGGPGRTGRP